jgi:hypothetical protein
MHFLSAPLAFVAIPYDFPKPITDPVTCSLAEPVPKRVAVSYH